MKTLFYKARNSNVEHVFSFEKNEELDQKMNEALKTGELLQCDWYSIHNFLAAGHTHVAYDHETIFEISNDSPGVDSETDSVSDGCEPHIRTQQ